MGRPVVNLAVAGDFVLVTQCFVADLCIDHVRRGQSSFEHCKGTGGKPTHDTG